MSISLKLTGIALLYIIAIILGFWLNKTGKPYSPLIFNIHKLVSLAAVVFTGIVVYNLLKQTESHPLLTLLIIAAVILYLALIVSGGLLNLDKPFYSLLRLVHKIMPAFALGLTIWIFYLMLKK